MDYPRERFGYTLLKDVVERESKQELPLVEVGLADDDDDEITATIHAHKIK